LTSPLNAMRLAACAFWCSVFCVKTPDATADSTSDKCIGVGNATDIANAIADRSDGSVHVCVEGEGTECAFASVRPKNKCLLASCLQGETQRMSLLLICSPALAVEQPLSTSLEWNSRCPHP
jgi:hypothetical protein